MGVVHDGGFSFRIREEESSVGVRSWQGEKSEGSGGDTVAIDSQEFSRVEVNRSEVEHAGCNHDFVASGDWLAVDLDDLSWVLAAEGIWALHFILIFQIIIKT